MMDTTFKEWLIDREFASLIEAVVFLEADALEAAMASNNAQFNRAFGIQKNWFGMILGQAARYAKGMDALSIASDAATEMLVAIHNKDMGDPFYAGLAPILQQEGPQKDNELSAYFTNAASLRVRRFGGTYRRKRDQMTKQFSALDKRSSSGGDDQRSIDGIADESQPLDAEERMDRMRRAIIMELEREKARTKDPRSQARLELAKKVAEKRMENPPNYPGIDELMAHFGIDSKGSMYNIMQDIQDASRRAAEAMGVNTAGLPQRKGA